jgi:hypothetical protein
MMGSPLVGTMMGNEADYNEEQEQVNKEKELRLLGIFLF